MPYISQNFINDLPNQIDIVDLIAKRVVLKKTGDGYRGACPFHGGKNSNFSVSAQKHFPDKNKSQVKQLVKQHFISLGIAFFESANCFYMKDATLKKR
jgi:hypothetical protein